MTMIRVHTQVIINTGQQQVEVSMKDTKSHSTSKLWKVSFQLIILHTVNGQAKYFKGINFHLDYFHTYISQVRTAEQ